jgi:hypothetical protein
MRSFDKEVDLVEEIGLLLSLLSSSTVYQRGMETITH